MKDSEVKPARSQGDTYGVHSNCYQEYILNEVRLKGGDPFIFGRSGEEALDLVSKQIPDEVIPGITAAIGGASSSLIPLTHRKVSRSVTFITAHVISGSLPGWFKSGRHWFSIWASKRYTTFGPVYYLPAYGCRPL